MAQITKRIVTDDGNRPVAVQIDYQDWLEIELKLKLIEAARKPMDVDRYRGVLALREDGVAFQRRIRDEWA